MARRFFKLYRILSGIVFFGALAAMERLVRRLSGDGRKKGKKAMVELYFIRHAIATEAGKGTSKDFQRPLTEKGAAKMKKAALGLERMGLAADVILTSPLLRAMETAKILQARLKAKGGIQVEESLAPGGALEDFLKRLKDGGARRVFLVGHEPGMGEWIKRLLGCGHGARITLKKGALCLMVLRKTSPKPEAELALLIQPRWLRSVSRGRADRRPEDDV